jgi:uncharacterized YigZ family protein
LTEHNTLEKLGKVRKDIKKSVFLGYAKPVNNETEASEFIKEIKQLHKDADHNVSAYLIKNSGELTVKYDDDGEPAGSSGKPIYKVLDLKNIQNTVVVVARYFGGIKLGFGGLSRAYKEAAIGAIDDAGVVEISDKARLKIQFDYTHINEIKSLVENYGKIYEEDYTEVVEFIFEIDNKSRDDFVQRLKNLTKNNIIIWYI